MGLRNWNELHVPSLQSPPASSLAFFLQLAQWHVNASCISEVVKSVLLLLTSLQGESTIDCCQLFLLLNVNGCCTLWP